MRETYPTGNFKSGQDFKSQRAKNRTRGVESARYEDGVCGGPKPADTWKGSTRKLEGKVTSAKISGQPDFQDRYGKERYTAARKPVG